MINLFMSIAIVIIIIVLQTIGYIKHDWSGFSNPIVYYWWMPTLIVSVLFHYKVYMIEYK